MAAQGGGEIVNSYISKRYGKILHIWEPMLTRNVWYVNCRTEKEFIAIVKRQLGIKIDPMTEPPKARFCVA